MKRIYNQGRSQDFLKGCWIMCTRSVQANFGQAHSKNGRSKFKLSQERILNVASMASELESRFSTKFWDKISFWLSLKLFFYSSWWFGVAKGWWMRLFYGLCRGGCSSPLSTPWSGLVHWFCNQQSIFATEIQQTLDVIMSKIYTPRCYILQC